MEVETAGALVAIELRIDVGLLDHDMLPVGIELFGDDHGEGCLDALADLRRLGIDRDGVVGRDADEGVHRRVGAAWRLGCVGGVAQVEPQQPAPCRPPA